LFNGFLHKCGQGLKILVAVNILKKVVIRHKITSKVVFTKYLILKYENSGMKKYSIILITA